MDANDYHEMTQSSPTVADQYISSLVSQARAAKAVDADYDPCACLRCWPHFWGCPLYKADEPGCLEQSCGGALAHLVSRQELKEALDECVKKTRTIKGGGANDVLFGQEKLELHVDLDTKFSV